MSAQNTGNESRSISSSHRMNNREIQLSCLEIMKRFSSLCESNGLRYFLCGGTLLGAVRHKGFIPWDDDVDVSMPRPDYERLLDLTVRDHPLLEDRFLFQNEENGYPRPYLRVYDTWTTVHHQTILHDEELSGNCLWIDIFPLDGLPGEERRLKRLFFVRDLINLGNTLSFAQPGKGKTKTKAFIKLLCVPLFRAIGSERFLSLMRRLCKRFPYETSEYVGALSYGLYGAKELMKKTEVEKTVLVEFEGDAYPTMSCWDSYLTNIYGDYMQVPPTEKRKIHEIDAFFVGPRLREQI